MTETDANDLAEAAADPQAEAAEQQAEDQQTLSLEVKIESSSACERHVTITVAREDVDRYFDREFDELMPKAEVPGFRPGRAPRKLVVNRFKDQIADQVKGKLLMDSMAQISETEELSPISEPDLDIDAVKIPDEGPMTFEFDIEVRPEFELPAWKGLDLEEPVHEINDEDIERHLRQVLARYASLKPIDGPAQAGDYVTLNVEFTHDGQTVSAVRETTLPVKAKLSLRDAELEDFGALMTGVQKGDTRETMVTVSDTVGREDLRGKQVGVAFEVLAVERMELPKLTSSFLQELGDFQSEQELREEVRAALQRQQRYRQQQHVRQQITHALIADANWELPPTLLERQAKRELRRMVLELQSAGFSTEAIQAHSNQLQRNSLAHTATALKEHFILERIAEEEKVDAEPADFDREVELIAEQEGVPPRRVRARLEKRGEMDALRNQIVERKVIERITAHATVKEVPLEQLEDDETALDHAVSGVRQRAEIPEAKHADGGKPLPETMERP